VQALRYSSAVSVGDVANAGEFLQFFHILSSELLLVAYLSHSPVHYLSLNFTFMSITSAYFRQGMEVSPVTPKSPYGNAAFKDSLDESKCNLCDILLFEMV
jgi:hypothetical protein